VHAAGSSHCGEIKSKSAFSRDSTAYDGGHARARAPAGPAPHAQPPRAGRRAVRGGGGGIRLCIGTCTACRRCRAVLCGAAVLRRAVVLRRIHATSYIVHYLTSSDDERAH
jgi:hypothetical protein